MNDHQPPPSYKKIHDENDQISQKISNTEEPKSPWVKIKQNDDFKDRRENSGLIQRNFDRGVMKTNQQSAIPHNKFNPEIRKATKSNSSTSSTSQSSGINIEDDNEFARQKWFLNKNPKEETNETYVKKNSLFVPKSCRNLLVGDSNMKNVVRKRLDRSGRTEVRTYRGVTVKILSDIIEKSTCTFPQVDKITICIGTNDCSRGEINETSLLNNVDHLISVIKEVFPNAIVNFLAIPPMKNAKANQCIKHVNSKLRKLVLERGTLFRACDTLWFHVNSDGTVDNGLLYDAVHLTNWGLGLLLQNVIPFFYNLQFDQKHTEHLLPDLEKNLFINDESYPQLDRLKGRISTELIPVNWRNNQQTTTITLETLV